VVGAYFVAKSGIKSLFAGAWNAKTISLFGMPLSKSHFKKQGKYKQKHTTYTPV
jgi:hypothetical protein